MKFISSYLLPFLALIVVLVLWQFGVLLFSIDKWLLPAPIQIFQALWDERLLIASHSVQTIIETVVGLGIAVIFGIGAAILMEWSPALKKLTRPLLITSQTIPFIVLAPLITIWLGFGVLPKIVVIVLACFFPIVITMLDGFGAVDRGMVRLLQSMGAGKKQIFKLVTFPTSLPYFFSGLRVSGTYAVGVAVVSEWIGAEKGLGILLLRSAKSYQTETLFASIFVIALLSFLTVLLVDVLARKSIPWHYLQKGGSAV